MAEEKNQKIKLMKIMEILRQETDEEHPMTKVELSARLVALNVSCSPRSLIRDIKLLNEQGYEIMERLMGHEKGYFVCDRSFSVPELKILIDAVQAASFVTEKKTDELVGKIAALGGSHRAAILKQYMVENTHEGIVTHEIFKKAQEERARRQNPKVLGVQHDVHDFTGLIECGVCGMRFNHKVNSSGMKWQNPIWASIARRRCSPATKRPWTKWSSRS